jgi:hypothetical protein
VGGGGHGLATAYYLAKNHGLNNVDLIARLADVAVLAVKVQSEETLLIVERSYGPHLMAAIRVSAADLAIPLFR